MDQEYMTKVATSFLDELTEIEKKAFLGKAVKFLKGGVKHLKSGAQTALKDGGGATMAVGGRGAARAGGVMKHMKQIYQGGAKGRGARTIVGRGKKNVVMGQPMTVGAQRGGGGMMGGLGALARSRYGQMGAVGAIGAGGLYAGSRALGGGRRRDR